MVVVDSAIASRIPLFTREIWRKYLDHLADFDIHEFHFFLSGGFRSKLYPESNAYRARGFDRKYGIHEMAVDDEDIRFLIRYAHSRDIAFYISSGVFGWEGITELVAGSNVVGWEGRMRDDEGRNIIGPKGYLKPRFPELQAVGAPEDTWIQGKPEMGWMCLSKDLTLEINENYLMEIMERYPEADGLGLEVACEGGHCTCPNCQAHAGEIELSFLRSFSEKFWKKHPTARLYWYMGYGSHADDYRYYEEIARFDDSRLWFILARPGLHYKDAAGIIHNFSDPETLNGLTLHPEQMLLFLAGGGSQLIRNIQLASRANLGGVIPGPDYHSWGDPQQYEWFVTTPPDPNALPFERKDELLYWAWMQAWFTDPWMSGEEALQKIVERFPEFADTIKSDISRIISVDDFVDFGA